jgi:hypothetical protein
MENMSYGDVSTPEQLIELAQKGGMTKQVLVRFLALGKRQRYLDACAALEKRYTDECAASGSPCLEGGCAVEGETCLEPVLRADHDYLKACGNLWAKLFTDPRNRADDCWR